mgnify:CR=1 FL=1|tara:strand:- start:38008 stop:38649 length:642 start_codon:yes stop_codon:yes gene_type:complete
MSLAEDMKTLASAGDQRRKCVECRNAYHVSTPDGIWIDGCGRCVSCQQSKPHNKKSVDVTKCISTNMAYVQKATGERVVIESVSLDYEGIYQVVFRTVAYSSTVSMRLTDFFLQYELDIITENDQKLAAPLAGNEKTYYYVTYSFLAGRRKTHKRGFTAISIKGLSIFNLSALQKQIKNEEQKQTGLKVHSVLIENWIKINETKYNDLMGHVL